MSDPTAPAPGATPAPAPSAAAPAAAPAAAAAAAPPAPAPEAPKTPEAKAPEAKAAEPEAKPENPSHVATRKALSEANEALLATLPEPAQKLLKSLAGDDPVRMATALREARTSGAFAAPPAPLPPAAQTAANPPPAAPQSTLAADAALLAQHTKLSKSGLTMAAAQFEGQHGEAIARARQAARASGQN